MSIISFVMEYWEGLLAVGLLALKIAETVVAQIAKRNEIENKAIDSHVDNSMAYTDSLEKDVAQLKDHVENLQDCYSDILEKLAKSERERDDAVVLASETEERFKSAEKRWSAKEADYEKRIGELEIELKQLKSKWQVVEDGIKTIIGLHPSNIEELSKQIEDFGKQIGVSNEKD